MGNPAGVKRDLEKRRLEAARLLKKGLHEAEVARRVGVHRQSVNRWARQLAESGFEGLKKAGRAGRKPRLREQDLQKIKAALCRGPEAYGFDSPRWTAGQVAALIERECGVAYTIGHAWWLLKKLGWSSHSSGKRTLRGQTELPGRS